MKRVETISWDNGDERAIATDYANTVAAGARRLGMATDIVWRAEEVIITTDCHPAIIAAQTCLMRGA